MTSLQHDHGHRSHVGSPLRAMSGSGQSARRRPGDLHVTVRRGGPVATMWVSGELTEIGHQHLAALLDLMVTSGCTQAVIHLAGVDMVDSGLLRVLRIVRTRLRGRLTVTAERAEARCRLMLVGVDPPAWSAGAPASAGADHVRG